VSLTTHSRSSLSINNLSSQDNFFDTSSSGEGFTLSNATVQIISAAANLYLDGQSVVSDSNLSIATTSTGTHIAFGTASTEALRIDSTGRINIKSGKLLINGDDGDSGQVLTTDGLGNISWTSPATAQYAFAGLQVNGQTTISATSTSENVEFEAGSGISLTTNTSASPKKITISNTNTAANAFSQFGVQAGSGSASGSNVEADSETDTLTFVAGSGITLTTDTNNDKITISSAGGSGGSQNIFASVGAPNQSTISAGSTSDTLNLETSTDPTGVVTRDGSLDILTDTSAKTVTLKAKIPITHSHSGKMPLSLKSGGASGVPLKNHFIPVTTSATVNGGGSTVAMSTRAIEVLQSDGSTLSRIIMPPTSDGKSLVFTSTLANGSTQTENINMGE
tara:strand:+ start:678 stop:1859 length:1182 start_codon:yes stop_codon:yes gene_type:complete